MLMFLSSLPFVQFARATCPTTSLKASNPESAEVNSFSAKMIPSTNAFRACSIDPTSIESSATARFFELKSALVGIPQARFADSLAFRTQNSWRANERIRFSVSRCLRPSSRVRCW